MPWLVLVLLAIPLLRARRVWRREAGAASLVAATLLLAVPGAARANFELIDSVTVPFVPIVGTQVPIASSSAQVIVDLPFQFRYWTGAAAGATALHTQVAVGCRGYIAFSASPTTGGPALNSATDPQCKGIPAATKNFPLIAPWWGPWECLPGAVTWAVSGVAPYRTFTIQWKDVWYREDPAGAAHGATFQVRLLETLNHVQLAYGASKMGEFVEPDPTTPKGLPLAGAGLAQNRVLGVSANNCTATQPQVGSKAECTPDDYANEMLDRTFTYGRPANLVMTRIYADEVGYAGVPMRMGATVWNDGSQPARNASVRFYLSTDASFDASKDPELGTSLPIDLAVDQRRDVAIRPLLPANLAQGTFYLFARVDPEDAVAEENNDDNTGPKGGIKFTVAPPRGDLVGGAVTGPTSAKAGDMVSVSFSVRNVGSAAIGPCAADADCGTALRCDAGRCRAPCATDNRCAEGRTCDTVKGICDTAVCTIDSDCPAGEGCESGACNTRRIPYIVVLSDIPTIGLGDRWLTANPVELNAGIGAFGEAALTGQLALPAKAELPTGRYYVGVIADPNGAVPELSETNNSTTEPLAITVVDDAVSLLTGATLPDAAVQSPYGILLQAFGGNGTFDFTITSGALPPGLTMTSAGYISGVPTASREQPYGFEVQVQSAAMTDRRSYTMKVLPAGVPLTLVTRDLPAASFGEPYSVGLSAVGGKAPYLWTLKEGLELPAGLVLSPEGIVKGVPVKDGTSVFQVEVEDSLGKHAAQALSLQVVAPERLRITVRPVFEGAVGEEFKADLYVAGGRPVFTWSIVETRMLPSVPTDVPAEATTLPPPGLSMTRDTNGKGAHLTGKPTTPGAWTVTVKVQDGSGTEDNATFAIVVRSELNFDIVTTALPDAIAGKPYFAQLVAVPSDVSEITWSITCPPTFAPDGSVQPCPNPLPEGFSLFENGVITTQDQPVVVPSVDPSTGKSPPRTTYSFLLKARDAQNRTAIRALSVTVRVDEPLPQAESNGCGCSAGASASGAASMTAALVAVLGLVRRRRRC